MIEQKKNRIYLIVPGEYKCVYYQILKTLGNLGKDLLSSCTSACKGRNIQGVVCFNMFNAACAAYYLGQVKLASTLIKYIKSQLNIGCDDTLVFENSFKDEWIYIETSDAFSCIFEKLMNKLAVWGQGLLDDCTSSCKNKNILIAWNMFQAAVIAYDNEEYDGAKKIGNYVGGLIESGCPDISFEPTPEPGPWTAPTIILFGPNYSLNDEHTELTIDSYVNIMDNEEELQEGSGSIINSFTGDVLASGLEIGLSTDEIVLDTPIVIPVAPNSTISLKFAGYCEYDGQTYESEPTDISIPPVEEYVAPTLGQLTLNTSYNSATKKLTIAGGSFPYTNPQNINSASYNLVRQINSTSSVIVAACISVSGINTGTFSCNVELDVEEGETYTFYVSCRSIKNIPIGTENYEITIPSSDYQVPTIVLSNPNLNRNGNNIISFTQLLTATNIANIDGAVEIWLRKTWQAGAEFNKVGQVALSGSTYNNAISINETITSNKTYTAVAIFYDTNGARHTSNELSIQAQFVDEEIAVYFGYNPTVINPEQIDVEEDGTYTDVLSSVKQFITGNSVEDYKLFWFALPQGYTPTACENQQFSGDDIVEDLSTAFIIINDENYTLYYIDFTRATDNTWKVTFE